MKPGSGIFAAKTRATELVVAVSLVLALLLAPVVIAVSHGPGAVRVAQHIVLSDQTHGLSHAEEDAGQHDATDHEHQVTAILTVPGKSAFDRNPLRLLHEAMRADGRSREGPRRPPRAVLI